MSEEVKTQPVSATAETTAEVKTEVNEDFVKQLIAKETSSFKQTIETLNKEKSGLDKKVTELSRMLKEKETEKLSKEQLLELKEKELKQERIEFSKAKILSKYGLMSETEDFSKINFGESEEDIVKNIETVKTYIDKMVKMGIEKGIEERISKGYQPKASIGGDQKNIFESMSNNELASKASEISKMPTSEEKSKLLNEIFNEQTKRMRR